jgi:hypothetical protein
MLEFALMEGKDTPTRMPNLLGAARKEHEFYHWINSTGVSGCSDQAKNVNVKSFSFFCNALKSIDHLRMELRNLMEGLFHLPQ